LDLLQPRLNRARFTVESWKIKEKRIRIIDLTKGWDYLRCNLQRVRRCASGPMGHTCQIRSVLVFMTHYWIYMTNFHFYLLILYNFVTWKLNITTILMRPTVSWHWISNRYFPFSSYSLVIVIMFSKQKEQTARCHVIFNLYMMVIHDGTFESWQYKSVAHDLDDSINPPPVVIQSGVAHQPFPLDPTCYKIK
jgi:hypothetical protein